MFSKGLGLYLDGKYPVKQNHTSSKSSTKVQCNKLISVLGHKLYGLCAILQLCFGECTSTCEVTSKFEFCAVHPPPSPPSDKFEAATWNMSTIKQVEKGRR